MHTMEHMAFCVCVGLHTHKTAVKIWGKDLKNTSRNTQDQCYGEFISLESVCSSNDLSLTKDLFLPISFEMQSQSRLKVSKLNNKYCKGNLLHHKVIILL